jgi:hypothetical protein
MSIENPNQPPKFEQADSEPFDEELALAKLQEFVDKILGLLEENQQFKANSKWWALVYGLGQRMGEEAVAAVLEKQGWSRDIFPEEILATFPFKPEVIYLVTPEQFKSLPEGTKLVDTSGDEVAVGDEDLKRETTKAGYLPFGFIAETKPAGLRLKQYNIDYALVAVRKKMKFDKYK